MNVLGLLRWGVPQDAPTLTLTSVSSDLTPDFVLSGDLAVGDTVRFEYGTDVTFTVFSQITNTIDAAEDAANQLNFATGALTNGQTYYFRARVERPPRGITAWSNVESITFNLAGYRSHFGFWFGGFSAPSPISGGYFSLFGRHLGGFGSSGIVVPRGVGFVRKKHTQTLEEFEAGRPRPFGRKWYEDFKAAELLAREAEKTVTGKYQKRAIQKAIKTAENIGAELQLTPFVPDLTPLIHALHAIALAETARKSIEASRQATEAARMIVEAIRDAQNDDEEALMLLLH